MRNALLLVAFVLTLAGCPQNGEQGRPCDHGTCLPGYVCNASNVCVTAPADAAVVGGADAGQPGSDASLSGTDGGAPGADASVEGQDTGNPTQGYSVANGGPRTLQPTTGDTTGFQVVDQGFEYGPTQTQSGGGYSVTGAVVP